MDSQSKNVLRRWAKTVLPWVIVAASVWYVGTRLGSRSTGLQGAAPQFAVQMADGQGFDLSAQRGHTVVLNFWASYCPPCRAEAPVLRRAHERLSQAGGMLLGLAVDSRSVPYASRLGMTYPQALATRQMLTDYRVDMLPTTVVVAPDGSIARTFVGEVHDHQLREAIDEANAIPAVASR